MIKQHLNTLSDIIYELNLGKSSADENYIEPEQILFAERLARIQINNYTMQTFSKRDDQQTMYGIGNDTFSNHTRTQLRNM
jgi:hypothetical protein